MEFEIINSSPTLSLRRMIIVASFIIMVCSCGFPLAVYGSFIESAGLANETDPQALLAFKDGLSSDPHDTLRSWNQSVYFCQWSGVTCGRRHQRVVVLNLDNRELKGPISPHIGNLSFLRILYLRNNSLEQKIPPELGRLGRLLIMSLRNNSISGEIPENISGCSNIKVLELSVNNLEGMIPTGIGNSMSKLEELYVHDNHLAGVIPTSLANLSSLRVFVAQNNDIHGSLPDEFGWLGSLEFFQVFSNKLVGTIPPSMFNISSITSFILSDNRFTGLLPSQLGGTIFPSLQNLFLDLNLFHGNIPVSISNASNLESLGLSWNKFTGQVPSMNKLKHLSRIALSDNSLGTAGREYDLSFLSSLTNTTFLSSLSLEHNNFGGELPRSVGNLSTKNLLELSFTSNEISGSIPEEIGNLVSLKNLHLDNNIFTGIIPSTIVKLTELGELDLSINRLNGTIPLSFGNFSVLTGIFLDGNNLQGTIPSSLGNCTNLLSLSLSSNSLHGIIPREIFSISSLVFLYLQENHFVGSLPTAIGGLMNLVELYISDNLFSGKVPPALGKCVMLNTLDLGTNNFSGILPSSLESLRGLEVFDLSQNNFSGNIPDFLASLKFLRSLNLSFNDFEGAIPERGIFKNTTALDVNGNIKLCGGVPQLQLPHCNSKTLKNSKNSNMKLLIVLVVGVTGAILLLCFLYVYLSKKSKKAASIPHSRILFLSLSYQSLREATNGFSAENLIGMGSFGSVYKGILDQGQQTVAVKVLNLQRQGASRSFLSECEALRRIRHRNLVKVLTACSSIDHQGNDFKALVYEYMANGSLDDWLHSHESQSKVQSDYSRNLNISHRLNIAIDVASALEYLHHLCKEPIVHCDLKPSNILLDGDIVGHVGDFGLAKFLQEHGHQSSENQSSSIGLRGSVGYVAPEYGIGNEVSMSGDVYSYGILLLEMFTGKRPTDHPVFNNYLNLHHYVKMALPEQVETIADPRLFIQPTCDGDEISTRRNNTWNPGLTSNENIEDCLVSLLEIGIACSREVPGDRMTISEALSQLHAIKKVFFGTGGVQRRWETEI